MKILYIDTETTGTDRNRHEIIQIAAIVEIDGDVKEEVNYQVQPKKWDQIDPEALKVTGKTIEELRTYPDATSVYAKFKNLLDRYVDKYNRDDRFYPAGHNLGFDMDFLNTFFKTYGDLYGMGSYQNWRFLDTRILGNILIANNLLTCNTVKLGDLCREYAIELDAHDAMNDIRATRQLYQAMLKHITQAGSVLYPDIKPNL